MQQGTLFLAGALSGAILVFVTVVVPSVNRTLEGLRADRLLRSVFNRFQGLGLILALGAAGLNFEESKTLAALFVLIALGFALNAKLLSPLIDKARAEHAAGRESAGRTFDRLHALTVRVLGYQTLALVFSLSFLF